MISNAGAFPPGGLSTSAVNGAWDLEWDLMPDARRTLGNRCWLHTAPWGLSIFHLVTKDDRCVV